MRAGVWTGVLLVSLLAGLLLGSAQAGFYMAARAFLLTFAFAAVGTELLNPVIRLRFERLGGGMFFETLEYSFSALPGIMAAFPPGREIVRRPVASLNCVISSAPYWLESLKAEVFIITGGHGSGKSLLVGELAEAIKKAGKKPGGIMARGYWAGNLRSGFDLVNLATGESAPLCRRGEKGDGIKAGEFGFYYAGLAFGEAALSPKKLINEDIIFIDEVGFLELEGKGWAQVLDTLTARPGARLVLVVRDYLLEQVRARWGLEEALVWETGKTSPGDALAQLLAVPPAVL
jgi:nucleoside-triphosphatase THEP1